MPGFELSTSVSRNEHSDHMTNMTPSIDVYKLIGLLNTFQSQFKLYSNNKIELENINTLILRVSVSTPHCANTANCGLT